jgi:hypothetical protein
MNNRKLPMAALAALTACQLFSGTVLSAERPDASAWTETWRMVKVGTLWYLAYGWGEGT